MKKILISVIAALTITLSFAQNQSQHLSFKGVPIDGTLNQYVQKMKQNGFTQVGTENDIAALKGDFAGYKNCLVGVATLNGKDLISKISVIFPERSDWSSLAKNYFSLKEMLTEKYGEPAGSVEEFEGSDVDDDNDRMYEVKMERCTYYTIFETDKGSIELQIIGSFSGCFVLLSYFDKINGEIVTQQAMDDL